MAKSSDSKQRILQAAREAFAAHGYAGARTQQIAERAGVNKQLLFYYFGSKASLFEAVLSDAARRLGGGRSTSGAQGVGADALRRQLAVTLRGVFADPELAQLVVRGIQSPVSGAATKAAVDLLVEQLRGTISQGQGIGLFRDDADPQLAGRQAVMLALGYVLLEPALGSGEPAQRRHEWIDGAVELMVRALRW